MSTQSMDQYSLPWVEKYRPSDLSDIISHESIINTITTLIQKNQLPHLLFHGPPGTGKTSTIFAIAKKIYGEKYRNMVLELNASDDRKIDTVREKIKTFADTRSVYSGSDSTASIRVKLVILDEADGMTDNAQCALRRVIEDFTKTTRFCIISNYLNKIDAAIQSRCTRFRFGPLPDASIRSRLQSISKKEKFDLTEDGIRGVINLSQGDMRKCINILQSATMAYPDVEINEERVYSCVGYPLPSDIEMILGWLLTDSFDAVVKSISNLQNQKGLALQDIISQIHPYVLKLEIPATSMIYLFDKMSSIEIRLSSVSTSSEKLHLGALVGAFQFVRSKV